MAKKIISEPSRTLMEYRLLPGLTKKDMHPTKISLKTPLVYHPNQDKYMINFPIVSAAMQSVSGDKMGIEMAKLGSVAFIFASQPIWSQAEMITKIKICMNRIIYKSIQIINNCISFLMRSNFFSYNTYISRIYNISIYI